MCFEFLCQILPSNAKYIAIVEETSDIKSVAKYSVYLKHAYLKESLDASQKLSVWVISESTDQNITVNVLPIERFEFGTLLINSN